MVVSWTVPEALATLADGNVAAVDVHLKLVGLAADYTLNADDSRFLQLSHFTQLVTRSRQVLSHASAQFSYLLALTIASTVRQVIMKWSIRLPTITNPSSQCRLWFAPQSRWQQRFQWGCGSSLFLVLPPCRKMIIFFIHTFLEVVYDQRTATFIHIKTKWRNRKQAKCTPIIRKDCLLLARGKRWNHCCHLAAAAQIRGDVESSDKWLLPATVIQKFLLVTFHSSKFILWNF